MASANHMRVIRGAAEDLVARSQMNAAELPDPSERPERALPPGNGTGEESGADLTLRERELLAFERQWWKYAGHKDQAIRELFDMSPTRYYQLINRLIDKREAMETDPMLVKRLRRLRSGRQRARSARRIGQ
jgi:Protein of unknown function (DUF3263)